ncbi:unnamed protein product [Blepharisma stoltei]|uniref:folate gamma-glutamyl hydrolase n=1 Tax=Blepharisma stoltei TaxID=1481888 RepID=A0AAU9IRV5_9CILI|nr:unnamed protein product [Blepharisma stoltei]
MAKKLIFILTLLFAALGRELLYPEPQKDNPDNWGNHPRPHRPKRRHDKDDHDDQDDSPHRWNHPIQNNTRPVIGILSLPIHPYEPWNTTANTYIAASYVKFVEMGGARVVPLRVDQSFEELNFLFSRLNGILFTGGGANVWTNDSIPTWTPDYTEKACYLYRLVKEANDNGNYYPLWGTCLGFEAIQVCENNEFETLGNFNGEPPYTQSHDFTPKAKWSYLFNGIGRKYGEIIRKIMTDRKTSLLSHSHGVSPSMYQGENNLTATFNMLSTMLDKSGNRFVGIIEGKKYPIFATQFHPEKNIYEWDPQVPQPHDFYSVKVSTYFADFLVSEARRNNNSFESEEELKPYLIYNWWPIYQNGYFTQSYYFQ